MQVGDNGVATVDGSSVAAVSRGSPRASLQVVGSAGLLRVWSREPLVRVDLLVLLSFGWKYGGSGWPVF